MTNKINDIFRTHGNEYMQRFPNMPVGHRKVISAIVDCRSGAYGYTVFRCSACGQKHLVSRSCGNRHCPACQHHKTQAWLEKQLNRQVPGQHFMITFTVPEEIRSLIRSNQNVAYQALFKASSQALKKLAADKRFIGCGLPGFTGVLHTWGRQLQYHPHIHYIVAGGGLSENKDIWIPSRRHFFVHVRPLSILFRSLFLKEMEKAGLKDRIPASVRKRKWVVNSQSVGDANATIRYLAPYVFKVAISSSRIVKVEDRHVYFKYKKHGSRRWRTARLEVVEFIRRFLQHVLPTGFMKVRHYGFMNPRCSVPWERIVGLIEAGTGQALPPVETAAVRHRYCPDCGGELVKLWVVLPLYHQRE